MPVKDRAFCRDYIDPKSLTEKDWKYFNSLNEDTINKYAREVKGKFTGVLGLDLDGEHPGKDKNGNLLLYEVGEGGAILDPLRDCRPDSKEFIQKAFEGKLFVVPTGKEKPVQFQFKLTPNKTKGIVNASFDFSKPMDDQMISKPERPNLWARIRHFFGGAKREYAEYENAKREYNAILGGHLKDKRSQQDRDEEKEALDKKESAAQKQRENLEKQQRVENVSRSLDKFRGLPDIQRELVMDIYGPKPVRKEDYCPEMYTTDQFNKLANYDLEQLSSKDNPVNDAEFAGLAMLGALTAPSAGDIRKTNLPIDLTRDEYVASISTFFTADLFNNGVKPRSSIGQYFEQAQVPGRDMAANALMEYKKGNKAPLGELIGKGLHFSAQYMDRKSMTANSEIVCNGLTAEVLNLLERDKDLMEGAKKAGMTQDDLDVARGDREILKIVRANDYAKARLQAAEKQEIVLSPDEKKECINARVRFETLSQTAAMQNEKLRTDNKAALDEEGRRHAAVRDPLNKKKNQIAAEQHQQGLTDEQYLDIGRRLAQAEAELHQAISINTFKESQILGQPELMKQFGKTVTDGTMDKKINDLVDSLLPGKEKLEKLSIKDLNRALEPRELFDENSPYATKAEVPAPEKQAELEKQAAQPPQQRVSGDGQPLPT